MTYLILPPARQQGDTLAAALRKQDRDSLCLVVTEPGEAEAALGEVLVDCMVLPPPLQERFHRLAPLQTHLVPWPAEMPADALAERLLRRP